MCLHLDFSTLAFEHCVNFSSKKVTAPHPSSPKVPVRLCPSIPLYFLVFLYYLVFPVISCILLCSPVFSCIPLCSPVFSCILLYSPCILFYPLLFSFIPLYSLLFPSILFYSLLFPCIPLYCLAFSCFLLLLSSLVFACISLAPFLHF